jgi:hypothetical protein
MQDKKQHFPSILALAVLALTLGLSVRAQAQTVTDFANFDGVDGARPFGQTVMQATNGRFYGTTTYSGGASGIDGMGNVYELTPMR